MPIARATALLLACAVAGCAGGGRYAGHWDGRRGYDGNGDYGYALAASQAEARSYGARAARAYPAPGTPGDPWGPHITEAASRFSVPEQWIRAVMRQESGGRQYDPDGSLITSSAGAMGLMQVMPRTYDILSRKYGLGGDPYEPHDNILAGTAYIREMFDIYGSPGFLAAYNAGPARLDAYLSGASALPDETVNYLASIAPRLGSEIAMTGPLAAYGGASAFAAAAPLPSVANPDRAYAGGGMVVQAGASMAPAAPADPSDQAFDGGGLVTPDAPTGRLTTRPMPAAAVQMASMPVVASPSGSAPVLAMPMRAGSMLGHPGASLSAAVATAPVIVPAVSVAPLAALRGGWGIQVGAYPDQAVSARAIATARSRAGDLLGAAEPMIAPVQRGGVLYRARLVGLSPENASASCARLTGQGMDCFTVPPGS